MGDFNAPPGGSGQVAFPATQNASADANTLDDYEEGTWTPTLITTGVDFTSVTYDASRAGTYTKIGRVVFLTGIMGTDAVTVGSATGTVRIGGLPFTVASDASLAVSFASGWAGEEPISALAVAAGTTIAPYYRATVDGNTTATAIADVGTGANANFFYFSGHYFV